MQSVLCKFSIFEEHRFQLREQDITSFSCLMKVKVQSRAQFDGRSGLHQLEILRFALLKTFQKKTNNEN